MTAAFAIVVMAQLPKSPETQVSPKARQQPGFPKGIIPFGRVLRDRVPEPPEANCFDVNVSIRRSLKARPTNIRA